MKKNTILTIIKERMKERQKKKKNGKKRTKRFRKIRYPYNLMPKA